MPWFLSTPATAVNCTRCAAPILVALDEGLTVRTDAYPIALGQEFVALLAGLRTFTYAWNQLIFRDAARIRSNQPAGHIHPEHKCPRRTT